MLILFSECKDSERREQWQGGNGVFRFATAKPHPIFYKYRKTRPISDGFRKNNVNYWAFREIRSIIPHL